MHSGAHAGAASAEAGSAVNACSWKPFAVTLHDGRQVLSDSEEWRHEMEARTIIAMPTVARRRAYLRGMIDDSGKHRDGVLQKRGEASVLRLEATIKQIWYSTRETG